MPYASANEIVHELMRRTGADDVDAIEQLIAEDMVNHAARPRGRAGW